MATYHGQDDSSNEDYDIQPSVLQLCKFGSRCTNVTCNRAHSQEELEQWRDKLLNMKREFKQGYHRLKLCKSLDEGARNRYCRNGTSCNYAHSQGELAYWSSAIAKPVERNRKASSNPGIRQLKEDSTLVLCDYKLKCKKRDDCPRAHSEEELEQWKVELQCTERPKADHHQLKLCKAPNGYCKKGLQCKFAHSQKELDAWIGSMPCRLSEGKLLEMCRNGERCKFRNRCRYAHNDKELSSWKEEHHQNYLRSAESIPERCSYTIDPPTCQRGTSCPYAHNEEEKQELITSLQAYNKAIPRPVPRVDKLLPYTLCDGKKSFNGECIYGSQCKQAHSQQELDTWEKQRKAEEAKVFAIRPFDPWASQLKMCGLAMGQRKCGVGANCPFAHSKEELQKWAQVRESIAQLPMLGPSPIDGSSMDPFLVSLIDFQRQIGDKLAFILNAVIKKAANDENFTDKLGNFIDYSRTKIDLSNLEGQQSASLFDLQYLLGYMQRNAATLAVFLGVEEAYLNGFVVDFLEIRNLLAHGLYKVNALEESTEKLVQRGLTFVKRIMVSQQQDESYDEDDDNYLDQDEDDNIRKGYDDLLHIQEILRDFLSYQRESTRREENYSTLTPYNKKMEAKKTLKKLQELYQAEKEPGTITKFLATSLGARFPI